MNKSLLIKIIIGILILLTILIAIFFSNINMDGHDEIDPNVLEYQNETRGKLIKVDNLSQLYLVKNCIQKYSLNRCAISSVKNYDSNNVTNNTAIQITNEKDRNEDYFKSTTYSMLAKNYISKKGINKEDMSGYSNKFEDVSVEIYDLYYLTQYDYVFAYFANGMIRESTTNEDIEFNYIVVIDEKNQTFEIYLDDYIENQDFSNLVDGSEIDFILPENVENREYNTYSRVSVKYEQAVQDTFYIIRRLMIYNKEKAYSLLTENMKLKFPEYIDFENFINNNKIFSLTYGSYNLKSGENGAIFEIYNSDYTMKIVVYYDGFSSFRYDIENI